MDLYEKLVSGEEKLSLVGLGYVGMPIAVAFARKVKVVGFDLNAEKIQLYKSGIDPTNEVGGEVVKICFLMELAGLNGRKKLSGYEVGSVIRYEGN